MAARTLRTHAPSLGSLPPELGCKLAEYLGGEELAAMRLVNGAWNKISKMAMRTRKRLTFEFRDVDKLVQFNDTFANYTPTEDIAAGKFCFMLAALDTAAAREPLDNFVQNFGRLVTSLSLDFTTDWSTASEDWFDSPQRDTVLAHVTLLLQEVKGHVQVLELLRFTGLRPTVIGLEPFPALRTLILENRIARRASLSTVALQEASITRLSLKVPAIMEFEWNCRGDLCGTNPSFLANVLRNLTRVNREVKVKLDMELPLFNIEDAEEETDDGGVLLCDLMTLTVRIVTLDLTVYSDVGDSDTLRQTLTWIGAQSDRLKKLRLQVSTEAPLGGLKLPRLRALEELAYSPRTQESQLQIHGPDYFPSLCKVSTVFTARDFTVALPQVKELVFYGGDSTGTSPFQFPPFPNLVTLTCPVKFIDLAALATLKKLRRLRVMLDSFSSDICAFWKQVTHGADTMTFDEIRALPETAENEIRTLPETAEVEIRTFPEKAEDEIRALPETAEDEIRALPETAENEIRTLPVKAEDEFGQRAEPPRFTHLGDLREIRIVVCEDTWCTKLDALLFLSKTKRLQRLQKLEIEVIDIYEEVCTQVPEVNLDELRKYHYSVFVTQFKPGC